MASTATDFLQMRVDLAQSRQLTRDIASARSRGDRREANRLLTERRRIDDRFDAREGDPRRGASYLTEAQRQLGRMDLAITSYHMGIGNLSNAMRAYAGAGVDVAVPDLVASTTCRTRGSTSTPRRCSGAAAWRMLTELQDDSSNYYWKVLACREILRLARQEPDRLAELVALHGGGASAAAGAASRGRHRLGRRRGPRRTTTLAWIQRVVGKIVPGRASRWRWSRTTGWTIDVTPRATRRTSRRRPSSTCSTG